MVEYADVEFGAGMALPRPDAVVGGWGGAASSKHVAPVVAGC
jgi:hypothetical protein